MNLTTPQSSPTPAHAALPPSSSAASQQNAASSTQLPPPATDAELVAANAQKAHAGARMAGQLRAKFNLVPPKGSAPRQTRAMEAPMQLSASRLEMKGMQKLSHGQFREGIRAWIPKYAHLAVDSSHLNVSQVNMLLDELGKAKKGSIETLDLPLGKVGVSMGKLTASLKTISDRNPKSKIQLSFHGRKMTAADGEKFGDALVGNRVTLVGLDATHGGEGMAAILDKIPESNVETLDIAGRDVTVYEKEIMQAMPKLQTLALNGSTTATAEALQNHKAAMARMESAFKQADKTFCGNGPRGQFEYHGTLSYGDCRDESIFGRVQVDGADSVRRSRSHRRLVLCSEGWGGS